MKDASGILDVSTRTVRLVAMAFVVFSLLDCLLYAAGSLLQIDDDAFARAARFGNAMPAVAQAVRSNLSHEDAGLGATYIDCGQQVCVLVRHAYCWSCLLTIAGLGFFAFVWLLIALWTAA